MLLLNSVVLNMVDSVRLTQVTSRGRGIYRCDVILGRKLGQLVLRQ